MEELPGGPAGGSESVKHNNRPQQYQARRASRQIHTYMHILHIYDDAKSELDETAVEGTHGARHANRQRPT